MRTFADMTDTASLTRWWPPSHQVPEILLDIAAVTSPLPREPLMTTGFWGINGGHVDDFYVTNGADLLDQFGLFLSSINGNYAIWYHEGASPGAEPVVYLEECRAVRVVAANIQVFFETFGSGRGIGGLTSFSDASLCGDLTSEQIAQRYADGAKIIACVKAAPPLPESAPVPDVRNYLKAFSAKQDLANRANPTLRSIAGLLKDQHSASIGSNLVMLHVVAAGDTLTVTSIEPEPGSQARPIETEALGPLLLKARRERALGATAPFGPWHEAWLRLYPDGDVAIHGMWDIRHRQ